MGNTKSIARNKGPKTDGRQGVKRSARGDSVTELIFEAFRLNGRLLSAGDKLGADLEITSARWQVLGAVKTEELTVSQIARKMGLTRQAVQRVANDLAKRKLVAFVDNPEHRKAKLVVLTTAGKKITREMDRRQAHWSDWLGQVAKPREIDHVARMLARFREKLETDYTPEDDSDS